MMYLYLAL